MARRSADAGSLIATADAASQIVVAFDDNKLASALFGQYGQNLALIERRLGVVAEQRGNHVGIAGSRDACEQARRVLESLYDELRRGRDLTTGDVEGAIRLAIAQGSLFDFDAATSRPSFEEINLRKRPVRARTAGQDAYIRTLRRHELVFGIGPAGTGKTWLAVAHAIALYERKEVDRIILSRPAVEAGERLGFLPGDMREKVDPYLRPIYDALFDLMDARIVERALQTSEIEIAPLAFMRGRTLANAAIILDEAQNTTSMQMKMFLTRLGENSRMIVTGDPSQVDLPAGQTSGLAEAVRLLADVEGIGHVVFTRDDVVRHELVGRIVAAYDNAPRRPFRGHASGPVRIVLSIFQRWQLNDSDAAVLMGADHARFIADLRADTSGLASKDMKDRVALLIRIYEGVHTLLREKDAEVRWINSKLPSLNDHSLLELMLRGSITDLAHVLAFVDEANGR